MTTRTFCWAPNRFDAFFSNITSTNLHVMASGSKLSLQSSDARTFFRKGLENRANFRRKMVLCTAALALLCLCCVLFLSTRHRFVQISKSTFVFANLQRHLGFNIFIHFQAFVLGSKAINILILFMRK